MQRLFVKSFFMENNEVKSFSNVKKGMSDWLKPQQKLNAMTFHTSVILNSL